jgi:hypothetical protein
MLARDELAPVLSKNPGELGGAWAPRACRASCGGHLAAVVGSPDRDGPARLVDVVPAQRGHLAEPPARREQGEGQRVPRAELGRGSQLLEHGAQLVGREGLAVARPVVGQGLDVERGRAREVEVSRGRAEHRAGDRELAVDGRGRALEREVPGLDVRVPHVGDPHVAQAGAQLRDPGLVPAARRGAQPGATSCEP